MPRVPMGPFIYPTKNIGPCSMNNSCIYQRVKGFFCSHKLIEFPKAKLTIVDYIGEPCCLVVEPTHSKNAGQIGSFSQVRLKINNVWVATASMVGAHIFLVNLVMFFPGHLFQQLGKIWNPGGLQTNFHKKLFQNHSNHTSTKQFCFSFLAPMNLGTTSSYPHCFNPKSWLSYRWGSRTQHRSPHGCNSSRPKEQCPVQLEARIVGEGTNFEICSWDTGISLKYTKWIWYPKNWITWITPQYKLDWVDTYVNWLAYSLHQRGVNMSSLVKLFSNNKYQHINVDISYCLDNTGSMVRFQFIVSYPKHSNTVINT